MSYLPVAYINEIFTRHIQKNIKTIFEIGSRDLLDAKNQCTRQKNYRTIFI